MKHECYIQVTAGNVAELSDLIDRPALVVGDELTCVCDFDNNSADPEVGYMVAWVSINDVTYTDEGKSHDVTHWFSMETLENDIQGAKMDNPQGD